MPVQRGPCELRRDQQPDGEAGNSPEYRDCRRKLDRAQIVIGPAIDLLGRQIHSGRFLDLDVFHKGFARARDARGWFHIRTDGTPAYDARFAEIEPFYNGQAHARTLAYVRLQRAAAEGRLMEGRN